MSRVLNDVEISAMLANSGDEGDEAEEDQYQPSYEREDPSDSSEDEAVSEDEDIPLVNYTWQKRPFSGKPVPTAAEREPTGVLKPAEYFEKYFTPELIEQFALATSQYYMTKTGLQMKPVCNAVEIQKFFGIHGMMGIIKFPRMKLYWNEKFKYEPIASAMPRERFFLLRTNLHCVNVLAANQAEEQAKNKLWRVQPVIDAVRNRCLELPRDAGNYSVDEQMIPFNGRAAGLKVVVKNKPRPVGLKNFVLTDYKGLVLDFEVYQGTTTNLPDAAQFGIGAGVILRLVTSLPERSFIYFDRYFSTLPLMNELVKRHQEGTGTLMMNRFNTKSHTRYEFKKDSKMRRGDCEQAVSGDGDIVVVKWKDNKGVYMTSTALGAEPCTPVSRWDKKNKRYIEVSCPAIVKNYNAFMGGVDICDQMMEAYRTWIRSSKWTLKSTLHFFDLAIVNSWFEYRDDCKAEKMKTSDIMDLFHFRLSICESLLSGAPRKRAREEPEFAEMPPEKYRVKPLPTPDLQQDGFNHWPVFDTLKQPRCCRAAGCTSRTRCRCTKCDIYLCLTKDRNCFYSFHN